MNAAQVSGVELSSGSINATGIQLQLFSGGGLATVFRGGSLRKNKLGTHTEHKAVTKMVGVGHVQEIGPCKLKFLAAQSHEYVLAQIKLRTLANNETPD